MKSANDTWRLTIEKASVLAQHQPALFDPVFWDRASYWRPVGTPWPAHALAALAPLSQLNVSPNDTTIGEGEAEAIVWGAIGRALLDRADHQSALVAFKRAEAATSHEDLRGWLRLAQGESLACLDQTPAATAVFVSLVTSPDQRLVQAATAALGGTKLRQGDTATGFHLLARSIESPDSANWPARAKAEADLGLAYLMKNDEANGLKWLHSAQAHFRSTGDVTSLSQSLWNEAAYLKQTKRATDESTVRSRLTTCESDSLLAKL
jgi:tetratricopeptide (TPR) repeat protein